jgi:hypothetical protein
MAGERISDKELKERIDKAYDLRYNQGYGQEKYVKWAKENYGDKSEQQYCQYFTKAREVYDETWKDKLQSLLGPATDELFRLLASEDQKIRQRAIDQIMKYTGNDVTKIQADIKGEINISFGDD